MWVDTEDLVGVGEIAERFDVTYQTVYTMTRQESFPDPIVVIGKRAIYHWRQVSLWREMHPSKNGRFMGRTNEDRRMILARARTVGTRKAAQEAGVSTQSLYNWRNQGLDR